mmetsp:Transcript_40129/g.94451  ORF Transcript_40129/g.94451 Transcript_40129/m.94451 type:complete len:210 (+) Transcript_40129:1974-2603(+)
MLALQPTWMCSAASSPPCRSCSRKATMLESCLAMSSPCRSPSLRTPCSSSTWLTSMSSTACQLRSTRSSAPSQRIWRRTGASLPEPSTRMAGICSCTARGLATSSWACSQHSDMKVTPCVCSSQSQLLLTTDLPPSTPTLSSFSRRMQFCTSEPTAPLSSCLASRSACLAPATQIASSLLCPTCTTMLPTIHQRPPLPSDDPMPPPSPT